MSTTINNTLPNQWDSSVTYTKGDTVSYLGVIYVSVVMDNENHNPALDIEYNYWKPLDIYLKDLTVMRHGDYSGDESFWERDNIYIDSNGWVYVNNETTGINVKGRDGTISFDELTPEQREQLRGPRGLQGEQGPIGATGPQGPMGEVVLTPEQIAALTGPQGKSTYQIWLDQGYTGTEQDFLDWVRSSLSQPDTQLSSTSPNPVENRAIYNALESYKAQISTLVNQLAAQVILLENKLKATYNGQDCYFRFGITENGKYGYIREGESQVIPFDYYDNVVQSGIVLQSPIPTPSSGDDPNSLATLLSSEVLNTTATSSPSFQPTSIRNVVSEDNNEDDGNHVYGSNVQTYTFDEYADTYTYIYKDGQFRVPISASDNFCGLTYANNTLISNNASAIEGIILDTTYSVGYTQAVFKVAPVNTGDVIQYEVGLGNSNATLPSVVEGTEKYDFLDGVLNREKEISFEISAQNKKLYFSTVTQGQYIITEIKVC